MSLNVIKAEAKHTADVIEVAQTCLPQICPDILEQSDIEAMLSAVYSESALDAAIADPEQWFYVMYSDVTFVGFGHLIRKSDDPTVAVLEKLFTRPEFQDYKSVYKLFQSLVKDSTVQGITEIEINIPECDKKWIQIFVEIGIEFEPWRKFETQFGSKTVTIWPGLLTIIPAF